MDNKPIKKGFARTPTKPQTPDPQALESFISKAATAAPFVEAEASRPEPQETKKTKTKAITRTFTMTEEDMDRINEAKMRIAAKAGHEYILNNSEIIRAGILALMRINEYELEAIAKELNRLQ